MGAGGMRVLINHRGTEGAEVGKKRGMMRR
jgi:hypothetical protein